MGEVPATLQTLQSLCLSGGGISSKRPMRALLGPLSRLKLSYECSKRTSSVSSSLTFSAISANVEPESETKSQEDDSPRLRKRASEPKVAGLRRASRRTVSALVVCGEPLPAQTALESAGDSASPQNRLRNEDGVRAAQARDTAVHFPSRLPVLKRGMDLPKEWNAEGGTVVLVDKPKGWTSFDVCAKIRQVVKVKKVGHAGTLDPMATGLLVVCVGPATKLADCYQGLSKVYTGTFRLGEATPSCDADTSVNDQKPWDHIMDSDIQIAKAAFMGDIDQIPPMFSAIQVGGERLYEKARRGEHIDVPARKVSIYEYEIQRSGLDRQELDFKVCCSKGTYIRSLCADLGTALNSCAHLTRLRREKIGELSVDDAWTVQDLVDTYSKLYRKCSI